MGTLDAAGQDVIFRSTRSFNAWTDKSVSDATRELLDRSPRLAFDDACQIV